MDIRINTNEMDTANQTIISEPLTEMTLAELNRILEIDKEPQFTKQDFEIALKKVAKKVMNHRVELTFGLLLDGKEVLSSSKSLEIVIRNLLRQGGGI